MSLGSLFIVLSLILFFAEGVGIRSIPAIDVWAHAAFVLGVLLGGWTLGPWWGPRV